MLAGMWWVVAVRRETELTARCGHTHRHRVTPLTTQPHTTHHTRLNTIISKNPRRSSWLGERCFVLRITEGWFGVQFSLMKTQLTKLITAIVWFHQSQYSLTHTMYTPVAVETKIRKLWGQIPPPYTR